MISELEIAKKAAKSMDTEHLKKELAQGIKSTRERFLWLGAVIVELEARGEKVEGDKYLIRLLRRIGQGELLVDIVVRFAGRPYTLAALKGLPLQDQELALDMTDEEVEEIVQTRRESSKPKPSAAQTHGGDHRKGPGMLEQAKFASVGDVSEMCLELVRQSEDPPAVAKKLLPELERIKNTKPAKQLV